MQGGSPYLVWGAERYTVVTKGVQGSEPLLLRGWKEVFYHDIAFLSLRPMMTNHHPGALDFYRVLLTELSPPRGHAY